MLADVALSATSVWDAGSQEGMLISASGPHRRSFPELAAAQLRGDRTDAKRPP